MGSTVKIIPNLIPRTEKQLLCATFLEAVIRFYEDPENMRAFEAWRRKKGGTADEPEGSRYAPGEISQPRPAAIGIQILGVSPRQLSRLIADGREPFAAIGANIGTSQKYIRIYTERLIAYLNGSLSGV